MSLLRIAGVRWLASSRPCCKEASVRAFRNNPGVQPALADSIRKVFGQLGLKYEEKSPVPPVAPLTPDFGKKETCAGLEPIRPIKHFTFNEEDYPPITDEELKNAPYEFSESTYGYVTNETPLCTNPRELKGVNAELYLIGMPVWRAPTIFHCKYFQLIYLDPSHYLARCRKSRPAAMFVTTTKNRTTLMNNKNVQTAVPEQMRSSLQPFKLAVHRNRLRLLLRPLFLKHFLADPVLVKRFDGLYKFVSEVLPRTDAEKAELEHYLEAAFDKVKKLDLNRMRQEAKHADKKIDWAKVAEVCRKMKMPVLKPNRS